MKSRRVISFPLWFCFLSFILWMGMIAPVYGEDWLKITGEKGFYFNYNSGYGSDTSTWFSGPGFNFSQSLLLDVEGQFGNNYFLQGHLVDVPNAPGQMFLELKGDHAGLRFGDGKLNSFSTPLTTWTGNFNGLEGYLRSSRNNLTLAIANPTGIPNKESRVIKAGRNYIYTSYQPILEGSLKVTLDGKLLTEGVDYQMNYYSGKLQLYFYPDQNLQLDLDYLYAPSEVLGNQFYALSDTQQWGSSRLGFSYFGSMPRSQKEPVLVGEVKSPTAYNLAGLQWGFQTQKWNWDAEFWTSYQTGNQSTWNYIDNMEGDAVESEAFSGTTDPMNWFVGGSGSGYLTIDQVFPNQDLQHTRDGKPSLALRYELQRTGDSVSIFHDFGSERDMTSLKDISLWMFENNPDLEVELQLITNENNYYSFKQLINGSGWQEFRLEPVYPVDSTILQTVGFPDLSRIRYIKLVVTSRTGSAHSGQLYFAPLTFCSRSYAEQRWSTTNSSTGSSIAVHSIVASPSDDIPGEPSDNHYLQLDYSLASGTGWASVAYQPVVVMDFSSYQNLRVYFNTETPVTVTLIATRAEQEYSIGQIVIPGSTGGWQQYTISLSGVPKRVLERVEKLTLRLSNSGSGLQTIKIDSMRVCDSALENASALKLRGIYQSGPWRNQVQWVNTNPGFRDVNTVTGYQQQTLRNITDYNQDNFRMHSDVETYRQTDVSAGFPLDGKMVALDIGWGDTQFTLSHSYETALEDIDLSYGGTRSETKVGIGRKWAGWNLDYQLRRFESTISGTQNTDNNSMVLKYQTGYWWGMGQIWRENNLANFIVTDSYGVNYGWGFDPPGTDKLIFHGGNVRGENSTGDFQRYFCQSDFSYGVNSLATINGTLKQSEAPEGDEDQVTAEHLYNITLLVTPSPLLNLTFNQVWRRWDVLDQGESTQYTRDYQLNYNWNSIERIGIFMRLEDLTNVTGAMNGSHYGINSDFVLISSWLTQVSLEMNRNSGTTELYDSEQANYKYSIKNSYHMNRNVWYWGPWAEGTDGSEGNGQWSRIMMQLGLERQLGKDCLYGVRLDSGKQEVDDETDLIWGTSMSLTFGNDPYLFQFSLRRQTYGNDAWISDILYRFIKTNNFSINLHSDYHYNLQTGRNVSARVDLLFYLH